MSRSPLLIHPTLDEVMRQAAKITLPKTEAEKFFYHYESNGWKVGRVPMKSFVSAMAGWRLRWLERLARGNQPGPGMEKMIAQKELERVLARMASLKESYSEHQSWSEKDKAEFLALRERRKVLNAKLGVMI